jgi:CRISPR type III-B/RAMP module RAMP protein Cmr1
MNRIEIQLEAVTATFLHVEPREEAKWRAAPFRGLARWWFRAVAGAGATPDKVREAENRLFGTAEKASPVIFRVNVNGTGDQTNADVNPGSRRNASIPALKAGSKVTVSVQPGPNGHDEHVAKAYAALWTAVHFGGIGQRSRRGAGSLRMLGVAGLENVNGEAPLPQPVPASAPEVYAEALTIGLQAVRKVLDTPRGGVPGAAPFPVLHRPHARTTVASKSWGPDERRAREGLMQLRREHHRNPNGRSEHEFGEIDQRVASPLWVRLADIGSTSTLVVCTLFEHDAATKLGADWANARRLVDSLGGVPVRL